VEELKQAVLTAADKLQGDRLLRDGSIVLRTDSDAAGGLILRAGPQRFEVVPHAGIEDGDPPLLEVVGDPGASPRSLAERRTLGSNSLQAEFGCEAT
jgi:hypothetical protein